MALQEQQTVTPETKTDHMTVTPFSALSKTTTDQTIFKHISSYFLRRLGSYPTMAAVGRVLCCGWVEALVDSVTSLPPFSQSKGSFSVMIRSFMLFSNTDMSSWTETRGWTRELRTGTGTGTGVRRVCGAYLVVWFGIVVQGQDVFQEDVEL